MRWQLFDNGFGPFCWRLLFVVFPFPFGKAQLMCNLCVDGAYRTVQCAYPLWIIFVRCMDVYVSAETKLKGDLLAPIVFSIAIIFYPLLYQGCTCSVWQCFRFLAVARVLARGGMSALQQTRARDSHQNIGVCFRPIERPRLMHAPTACIQSQQGDTLHPRYLALAVFSARV